MMGGDNITLGCQYTYGSRLDLQLQNNVEGKKNSIHSFFSLSEPSSSYDLVFPAWK